MTKRDKIKAKIQRKQEQIVMINNDIIELNRQNALLCDKEQWFTEKIESHPKRKYQRNLNELDSKLVGRIHWNEDFKDMDTGNVITIERSRVVRIDGEWI